MSGTFSDYQVHQWLAELTANCYVSLHFDSPLAGGAYASEFQGDGYTRVKALFSNPSNRSVWNYNPMRFSGLGAGLITWIGGWDAADGGNLLWADQLAESVRVLSGGGYMINAEDLVLSFA